MDILNQNVNMELENIKKAQFTSWNKTLEAMNGRLSYTEEHISDL